jgi:hypothetical protein
LDSFEIILKNVESQEVPHLGIKQLKRHCIGGVVAFFMQGYVEKTAGFAGLSKKSHAGAEFQVVGVAEYFSNGLGTFPNGTRAFDEARTKDRMGEVVYGLL